MWCFKLFLFCIYYKVSLFSLSVIHPPSSVIIVPKLVLYGMKLNPVVWNISGRHTLPCCATDTHYRFILRGRRVGWRERKMDRERSGGRCEAFSLSSFLSFSTTLIYGSLNLSSLSLGFLAAAGFLFLPYVMKAQPPSNLPPLPHCVSLPFLPPPPVLLFSPPIHSVLAKTNSWLGGGNRHYRALLVRAERGGGGGGEVVLL